MPTPKNNTHCKKYIITAVKYVTRWTVAQAVVNHTGKDIRRFIGKEIVSKFGAPKLLITDGGPKLVANATKVYLAKQGIGQSVTTPYHPQANGRVKQLNGSLTQALAKLTANNPLAWAQHLPTALMVCRVQVNRGTGVSPYKAVFGTNPVFNSTGTVPKLIIPEQVPPRTHPNIKRVMEDMPKSEAKRVRKSAIPLQGRFDVGDEVWVLNTNHSKLQPEKLGPAVVVVVHPNNTYTVKGLNKKYPNRTKHLHHDCLRLCKAREAQRNSRLPASAKQLKKYGARVPDSLPVNTPPSEAPRGTAASIWASCANHPGPPGAGEGVATSALSSARGSLQPTWLYVSQVKSNYLDVATSDNEATSTGPRVSCSEMDRLCLPSPEPLAEDAGNVPNSTVLNPTPNQDQ